MNKKNRGTRGLICVYKGNIHINQAINYYFSVSQIVIPFTNCTAFKQEMLSVLWYWTNIYANRTQIPNFLYSSKNYLGQNVVLLQNSVAKSPQLLIFLDLIPEGAMLRYRMFVVLYLLFGDRLLPPATNLRIFSSAD